MDNNTATAERSALETAETNPTPPKKRSKAWLFFGIPLAVLAVFFLLQDAAQAHVAAAITPTVAAADTITSEAQTLDEQYNATCSDPAWDEGLSLTGGTGSGEVMDAITSTCTTLGVENQDYVAAVETSTSIWTNIGDGFGEVTDTIRQAVGAGDIEQAIRELFAQSETEAN